MGEVIAMMHYLSWNDSYNAWWWIIPLVVFTLVAVGVIASAVVHAQRTDRLTRSSTSRAEQGILWRFASGEIDADECNERLRALRDRRRHRAPQPH